MTDIQAHLVILHQQRSDQKMLPVHGRRCSVALHHWAPLHWFPARWVPGFVWLIPLNAPCAQWLRQREALD